MAVGIATGTDTTTVRPIDPITGPDIVREAAAGLTRDTVPEAVVAGLARDTVPEAVGAGLARDTAREAVLRAEVADPTEAVLPAVAEKAGDNSEAWLSEMLSHPGVCATNVRMLSKDGK